MRSTPYGLPPTWSSIHDSSLSSQSGVNAVAPSTPNPPALVTAATTSLQWLNAKSGKSIPNCSQMAGFTPPVLLSHISAGQEPADLVEHLRSVEQVGVVVPGATDDDVSLGFDCGIEQPAAQRRWNDVVAVACDHQQRRGQRGDAVD